MSYYILSVGFERGKYILERACEDTFMYVLVNVEFCGDSVFCAVRAVDRSGNVSGYSRELGFVVDTVLLDFSEDENGRIDLEDLREVLRQMRESWGRRVYR